VRLPDPTAATVATETVLRRVDATERIARLDVALRAAAVSLRGRPASVLAVLDRADGRLLLQLSGPADAVAPFEPVAQDRWLLPGRVDVVELAPLARSAAVPCPTLVHLGHGLEGDVFVDLEGIGSLSIDGPPDTVVDVIRAVVSSLEVSPFADVVSVVAVGTDVGRGGSRLTVVDDVDTAVDLVAPVVGVTAAATASGTTTFAMRARTPDEAWDPAVLVIGPPAAGDAAVSELVALTTPPGRGLGVVVGAPLSRAGCVLAAGERSWTLEPFGIALTPVGVGADDVAAVRELLDRSMPPPRSDIQVTSSETRQCHERPSAAPEPFAEPPMALMVRLLGPLRVEDTSGHEVSVEKGKALELVAWLALHREHPSRSSARSALWDIEVRDATFANVVSEARRALARSVSPPDGEEWIARTLTDLLPLHPLVVTDADLVRARMAHARRQVPADAVETLRPALALVRDVPLVGCDATWADAEGHTTDLTMLASVLAQELAERCLDIGDVDGALSATAVGLRVLPGHEALVGLRMRARAAAGDLAGVRVEWEAYERVVAADPWAGGTPAAELVTLRRDLLTPTP
jgi:DNA-binding SARP family transcriptional activator